MIEGLASRFINERKQILTHIRIICLFFPFVLFFRRCRETEVRICCQLDFVDVMYQIWFYRNKKKILLKADEILSFL